MKPSLFSVTSRQSILAHPVFLAASVVLVALMLYARVLGFDYVWDDVPIFTGKIQALRGQFSWADAALPFIAEFTDYFRPLVTLSFYADTQIAGYYSPGFSHGVNLFFFCLNALLVFSLCRKMALLLGRGASARLAFFAALTYVVHPALTETTAWISGRFDVLMTFFSLSAARVYVSDLKRAPKVALAVFLTGLGLLSKETAAVTPAALLCLWMALHAGEASGGKPLKDLWRLFRRALWENRVLLLAFLVLFLVYFFLRFQSVTPFAQPEDTVVPYPERFYLILAACLFYVRQALFPFFSVAPQHSVEEFLLPLMNSGLLIGYVALSASLVGVFFWALLKHSCAAWVFMAGLFYLLPVLHIFPLAIGNNIGHERFLTAPLAFWAIAVVLMPYGRFLDAPFFLRFFAAMRFLTPCRLAGVAVAIWLGGAVWSTLGTVQVWKNDLTLWQWNYLQNPSDSYSRKQYFSAALKLDRHDLVIKTMDALQKNPDTAKTLTMEDWFLLGQALLKNNDPAGMAYLRKVIDSVEMAHWHEHPEYKFDHLNAIVMADGLRRTSSLYQTYAMSVAIFEDKPEEALRWLDIALWYAQKAGDSDNALSRRYLQSQRVTYLYQAGKFEEGDREIAMLASPNEQNYVRGKAEELLEAYCLPEDVKAYPQRKKLCENWDRHMAGRVKKADDARKNQSASVQ